MAISDAETASFELVGSDSSDAYKLCSTRHADDLSKCRDGTAFTKDLATGALLSEGGQEFLVIGKDRSPSVRPGVEFWVWPEEIVGEPADVSVVWTDSLTLGYPLAVVSVPALARHMCVQVAFEGVVQWETVVFVGDPPNTVGAEC